MMFDTHELPKEDHRAMPASSATLPRSWSATARPGRIIFVLFILTLAGQALEQKTTPAAKQPVRTSGKTPATPGGGWRAELIRKTQAPITIIEFFDYQCPYCARTISPLEETLKSYRGQVRLVLKNMPLPIHSDSMLAHQAALAAGEQGRFWEMHDLLFAHQKQVKQPDLLNYARQLHLDLARFQRSLASGKFKATIDHDLADARSRGVTATPTFFVNSTRMVGAQTRQSLTNAIEAILHPGRAPVAVADSEPPANAVDLTNAVYRGRQDAPVTIVEFSDLQCPYCASAAPALKALLQKNPDQVSWVFKNYPLDFHKDAPLAHRALLAAGEQGKFWAMHDLIFSGQKHMKREDLIEMARSLNLNMERFLADLDSAKTTKTLMKDKQEGDRLGVDGTPAYLINGEPYSGAMRLEQLQVLVDKALMRLGPAAFKNLSPAGTNALGDINVGPAEAPITITWFSDLHSSLALKATLLVRQIINTHPGKVRLEFRNLPLDNHPAAIMLHEAALAAHAQGKFWQMHDLIIADPAGTGREELLGYARRLGLDMGRFQSDLDSAKYRPIIERDLLEARRRGVLGTPVFFVNATRVDGLPLESRFNELISSQLAAEHPLR